MRNISKNILYLMLAFSVAACFASDSIVPYLGLATQTIATGRDLTTYCFPGEEEQRKAFELHEKIKFKKIRKDFIRCLTKNGSSLKIGELGAPAECSELAELFAKLDDKEELTSMIETFNQNKNYKN
jgi:hypothetical protein